MERSLAGTVFVGFYFVCLLWWTLHSIIFFLDIIIPWNITWMTHLYYNGAFLVSIVLGMIATMSLGSILLVPSFSEPDSSRFLFTVFGYLPVMFCYSQMRNEPVSTIGAGWFVGDLRYPGFFDDYYFLMTSTFFMITMRAGLVADDMKSGMANLFRPFKLVPEVGAKENLSGLLVLASVYAGFWYSFFALSSLWYERICIAILLSVFPFYVGTAKQFYTVRDNFFLSFIPLYAVARGIFSYFEWTANGSNVAFAGKLLYCIVQVVIFASWYADQNSLVAQWMIPYLIDKSGSECEDIKSEPVLDTHEAQDDAHDDADSGVGVGVNSELLGVRSRPIINTNMNGDN